jgi:hypothetical protein
VFVLDIVPKPRQYHVDATQFVCSGNSLVESEVTNSQREWITYDFLVILHAGLGNLARVKDMEINADDLAHCRALEHLQQSL